MNLLHKYYALYLHLNHCFLQNTLHIKYSNKNCGIHTTPLTRNFDLGIFNSSKIMVFSKVLLCIYIALIGFIGLINGDCYLHFPRGSNNRLNEQSANRNNANRLYDTQNNNRGGYNVCDLDCDDGFNANDWMATANEMYDMRFLFEKNDNNAANVLKKQYEEVFFTESVLSTTWTVQHGSFNQKLLSQIILQFTCDTNPRPDPGLTATQYSGPFSTVAGNNVQCATSNCKVYNDI